ncbi:MAG: SDR family NAD(P)-dependent oxidoreductase [Pseudomonadota bacterium]
MAQTDRPVALITGGGTGVGAATARALAGRGWNLALNYRRSAREAEETASACRKLGAEAEILQGDVAEDADCRRMAEDAAALWGRIDGLVNNAGMTQFAELGDLEAQNAEDFARIHAVNVVGPYQMARACAPWLRRSDRGAVVNVSSASAETGSGSSIPYVASKGALNSLTRSLARVLAPEVRVNAVAPGLIDTRWFEEGLGADAAAKVRDAYAGKAALRSWCTAEDVADAILFLVEARKITGEVLTVDAGFAYGPAPKPKG